MNSDADEVNDGEEKNDQELLSEDVRKPQVVSSFALDDTEYVAVKQKHFNALHAKLADSSVYSQKSAVELCYTTVTGKPAPVAQWAVNRPQCLLT